ncbi:hypothetical protein BKA69DRAFT_1128256 [Paraphysoderma sedebokerense]|nr:hypothetical protein BKA69DRAFT_1128243 [Paraphysoderma sedebokerense]KAI9137391.1 hypothetical protein BKA69DRAFT_1128256 [Paraphysoderma sedebokerense]
MPRQQRNVTERKTSPKPHQLSSTPTNTPIHTPSTEPSESAKPKLSFLRSFIQGLGHGFGSAFGKFISRLLISGASIGFTYVVTRTDVGYNLATKIWPEHRVQLWIDKYRVWKRVAVGISRIVVRTFNNSDVLLFKFFPFPAISLVTFGTVSYKINSFIRQRKQRRLKYKSTKNESSGLISEEEEEEVITQSKPKVIRIVEVQEDEKLRIENM